MDDALHELTAGWIVKAAEGVLQLVGERLGVSIRP